MSFSYKVAYCSNCGHLAFFWKEEMIFDEVSYSTVVVEDGEYKHLSRGQKDRKIEKVHSIKLKCVNCGSDNVQTMNVDRDVIENAIGSVEDQFAVYIGKIDNPTPESLGYAIMRRFSGSDDSVRSYTLDFDEHDDTL